jgi:FtsZ-binding cell division protein ZapB
MNSNVPMLNEFAGRNTVEVIRMLNETICQQQAEIEALKAENSHLKYEISSGAWNPAELTDEGITAVWQTDECYQNAQAFARAILRKAQERQGNK